MIKKFEEFGTLVSHINQLEKGDVITYQGSKYEVVEPDEFAVKVKSVQTGREMLINQGQIEQHSANYWFKKLS